MFLHLARSWRRVSIICGTCLVFHSVRRTAPVLLDMIVVPVVEAGASSAAWFGVGEENSNSAATGWKHALVTLRSSARSVSQ
jgi:hypothetical protein